MVGMKRMVRNTLCGAILPLIALAIDPLNAHAVEIETKAFDDFRVLFLIGDFEREDDPRELASAIATTNPRFVSFNSPGGNIYAAMAFGRMIRLHAIPTLQLRDLECASACALAFLGGSERFAEPGSIGMHKTSFVDSSSLSTGDAVSAVQSATADVVAYMVEMGIDPSLLQLSLRYEAWDIRYLSGSEMEAYRVVTSPWSSPAQAEDKAPDNGAVASRQPPAQEQQIRMVSPDDAKGGLVRREKGYALLMAEPSTGAAELRVLDNGERVAITGTTDRWYRVELRSSHRGWVHHTWIKVDEFYDAGFEAKHVQIKSFANLENVQNYLLNNPIDLDAFVATNGWYAITLNGTFREAEAASLLGSLKAEGRIPSDSYQTYGNTYMQKLCCD